MNLLQCVQKYIYNQFRIVHYYVCQNTSHQYYTILRLAMYRVIPQTRSPVSLLIVSGYIRCYSTEAVRYCRVIENSMDQHLREVSLYN